MSQRDEEIPEQAAGSEKSKLDISKLISIIPPVSELRGEKKVISEKRIRIRFDRSLDRPIARVPSQVAKELGVRNGDVVEVVVAGKKKTILKAEVIESGENAVAVYPGDLERQGVSDNSIATIRKSKGA
ncbi:MAG: hypothetical protein QXK88_05690 [Desulfurococcaceae archaeon]